MKFAALIALTALASGIIAGAILWFRERWRREAFPASDAPALLNPARRLIQSPARVVQATGIAAGNNVLELGPGPGYFTAEIASAVGTSGRVIALDLQPAMLTALRQHVPNSTRVDLVAGEAAHLPLRNGALDAAVLVAMLGEVPDPDATVGELARVLRPGGIASFCESVNDPDYVRLAVLRRMCWDNGLTALDWRRQLLGYLARFSRPKSGA